MAAMVSSPMELVGSGPEDAEIAANLLPKTQPHGLSLGDRACLALAMTRSIPAMTADRAWLEVPVDVTIRCIRHLPLNPSRWWLTLTPAAVKSQPPKNRTSMRETTVRSGYPGTARSRSLRAFVLAISARASRASSADLNFTTPRG